ncbi:MAG: ribosomal protein [Gammaproteobacteria bacterium]|jgi:small subunit ribosomal protein S14|nr:ribosomal protein [Gammaproteobacteria bacterium]
MAKKSMIAREKKRINMSNSAKLKRRELAAVIFSLSSSYEDKMAAVASLSKRPRDESPCRVKNRCESCARPRAVYRRFALCRICLREAVLRGDVPGVSKGSW